MNDVEPVQYGDWSPERRSWLFGLTGLGMAAALAGSLPPLAAVASGEWARAAAWTTGWALLVAGVAVPVAGRPAAGWGRDGLLFMTGGLMGWTTWRSLASQGHAQDLDDADLPGVLARVRTHDGPPYGPLQIRPVLIEDVAAGTWAAIARVTHPGIGMVEPAQRARMADGMAELLEAAASADLMTSIAIQVRTLPDDGAERAAWVRRAQRRDAPSLALRVSEQLTATVVPAAVRHEVFVTVVVSDRQIAGAARQAGGGVLGRGRVLQTVMSEVEARLLGQVGADAVSWLESADLAEVIRTGFAPGDRAGLVAHANATQDRRAPRPPGHPITRLPMAAAGPSSAPSPPVRHYVHDAWSSVSCAVLLPDKGAVMGALAPVLVPARAGERRCLTVFAQTLPPALAQRMTGREALSHETAVELRHRLGFATRAAHRRDADRVTSRDSRLAHGKALLRVAAVAAVTVPSTWSPADAGRGLEASIRAAGFTPLRLDLAQDSGFAAACVPLGIGLPRRGGPR